MSVSVMRLSLPLLLMLQVATGCSSHHETDRASTNDRQLMAIGDEEPTFMGNMALTDPMPSGSPSPAPSQTPTPSQSPSPSPAPGPGTCAANQKWDGTKWVKNILNQCTTGNVPSPDFAKCTQTNPYQYDCPCSCVPKPSPAPSPSPLPNCSTDLATIYANCKAQLGPKTPEQKYAVGNNGGAAACQINNMELEREGTGYPCINTAVNPPRQDTMACVVCRPKATPSPSPTPSQSPSPTPTPSMAP